MGQKCPKRLRLLVGKNTHEYMDRIVPGKDINASHDRAPKASQSRARFGEETCRGLARPPLWHMTLHARLSAGVIIY
jgi:hypothetical protein